MGRKKILIQPIHDPKLRNVLFIDFLTLFFFDRSRIIKGSLPC